MSFGIWKEVDYQMDVQLPIKQKSFHQIILSSQKLLDVTFLNILLYIM